MERKNTNNNKRFGGSKKAVTFQVEKNALLMEFLMEQMPQKSRNNIKSLLGHKQIFVDGNPVSQFNYQLIPGQQVEVGGIRVAQEQKFKEYTIVYEDQYLIVIDKAAGLLAMTPEKEKKVSAYDLLSRHVNKQDRQGRLYMVLSLDRETSGLMMFARNTKIRDKLIENQNLSPTVRNYVAIVEGVVEKPEGAIETYLSEDKVFKMHSSLNPSQGKKAVTQYSVIKQNESFSLLSINPVTNLKNQVRIHMSEMGYCIAGDRKYDAVTDPIKRLGLHAYQLSFKHPVSDKNINLETKVPRSFMRIFQDKNL